MAQWVRAFASKEEGCVFESQSTDLSRQFKTGSDSSTAKRSAIGVLRDGHYERIPRVTVGVPR